jgi:excisionase family DNA binding protein
MASDDEILTVKEVCELLRVHRSTVYKLVREGKIPSFRIGSDWRFRKDMLLRWIAEKSMRARQLREVVDSSANGEARHR